MTVTRLTGGLTPGDGGDPRTFPEIFNGFADEFEEVQSRGFRFVETLYFTSSGTFTKADFPWLRAVRVRGVGGGGGGGGGHSTESQAGAGGGGAAFAESFLLASVLPDTSSVTVGAAGVGGAPSTNGSSGSDSFFINTSTFRCRFGIGGQNPDTSFGAGGTTIAGSIGDLVIEGNPGSPSLRSLLQIPSGRGGWNILGAGGSERVAFTNQNGAPGTGFGAGGSGACRNASGGDGSPGVIILELFA